jgi:hypothetical protein
VKRNSPALAALLCLLAAGASAYGAPAAQGTKPPANAKAPDAKPAPPPALPGPSAVAQRGAPVESSLRTLAESAKQVEADVRVLAEERRVLRLSMQTGRRELNRQLDGARRAKKRHETAAAKPGGKPQPADLETARQGFNAALEAGKTLQSQTKQLQSIEQKLEQLAAKARELERTGKAASTELKGVDRELGPALTRLDTQLGSARSSAQQARAQSGFASQSYAAAKAKTDKALAGTDAALGMLAQEQQELAAAEKALTAAPAAPASAACKTLTDSQLKPGTYARKEQPDVLLSVSPECDSPSVLRGKRDTVLASSVIRREKLDGVAQATMLMEEGDLCYRYALHPSKAGGVMLRWAPDPSASANRVVAAGCKTIEGEYVSVAAPAAAAPAGKACDIKQLAWDKMTSLPGHGELTRSEDYSDTQESVDQVLYGDLDADGASEAYVTVSTHYGANNGHLNLYVYSMTPACSLQVHGNLLLPGGCSGVGDISVAGRRLKIADIPIVDEDDMEARCFPSKFRSEEYTLEKGQLKLVKSTNSK